MFLSRKVFNTEKPSSCIINYYSVKFPLKVLGINEVSSRREILNLLLKVQAHYIYMNLLLVFYILNHMQTVIKRIPIFRF